MHNPILAWGAFAAVGALIALVSRRFGSPAREESRHDVLIEHVRGGHGTGGI
jgi:hypothetical protein